MHAFAYVTETEEREKTVGEDADEVTMKILRRFDSALGTFRKDQSNFKT